jgi:hypothetical protein
MKTISPTLALLWATALSAATIHVDQNSSAASDANSGTKHRPFKSISAGKWDESLVKGGDKVPLMRWGNLLAYQNLADLRATEGFEKDGAVFDPQFADWKNLDLRVPADSPLIKMGCYPKGEVPAVKLGVINK